MNRKKLKLNSKFSDLLERLGPQAKHPCLFDGEGWSRSLAWNPCDLYILDSKDETYEELEEFIEKHRLRRHLVAGYISYDMGYRLSGLASKQSEYPHLILYAYDNYLTESAEGISACYEDESFLSEVNELDKQPAKKDIALPEFKTSWDKKDFVAAFEKIKEYIYEGYIYQINLAHELRGETGQDPRGLYTKLSRTNTAKMKAYLECGGFELLSMSPERFVHINKDDVETSPIKGTRPRGRTPAQDAANEKDLLSDEKEKAELNMITDLLRNDLGKVCRPGSVIVAKDRKLDKLTSVMHTSSLIKGKLKAGISPMGALLSMFPGGSITGCPKKKAMEIIDELEATSRGPYCGCMIMIDGNGILDSSILIRTIVKNGRRLSLSVGSGIVYDSKVDNEYQETLYKAAPLMGGLLKS
jgi:anthranilate/para-aminobenzoate synthase component I